MKLISRSFMLVLNKIFNTSSPIWTYQLTPFLLYTLMDIYIEKNYLIS